MRVALSRKIGDRRHEGYALSGRSTVSDAEGDSGAAPRDRPPDGPASPGAMAEAAEEALAAAGAGADAAELRFLLWQATGDGAHLAAAKRLLDESLAKVPAEYHAAMLANVRVNRAIAAAAEAAGL